MAQIRAGTCALNHSEKPEDFIKSRETGGFGKDASAAAASGASQRLQDHLAQIIGNVVPIVERANAKRWKRTRPFGEAGPY
jgi:hypothetical protein